MNHISASAEEARALIMDAMGRLVADGVFPSEPLPAFNIEIPADRAHGDFASNVAMASAKALHMAPRKIAEEIVNALVLEGSSFEKAEIAGPGFLNFYLSQKWYSRVVQNVIAEDKAYGNSDTGKGERVLVEFVSANPTGPMHVGNARGGAIGDTQDVVYPVTEGSEQNISADATEATFRINCDYEKFSGVVKVDGKELKRGTDYTDKSGSTVITLTESYLKTLAPGKHTMEAVFEDGYAKAGFTIEEATETTTEPVTDKPTEPIVTEPQPTTPKPTSSVVKPSSKLKNNPVKVTVKAKIVKLKKLKKKAQTIKAITIKSAKGKVSCKITKAAKIKKYLKINAKGVITFKAWKKAKKGTYKIKVKITVKGNSKYKPKTIKKTVKITLN